MVETAEKKKSIQQLANELRPHLLAICPNLLEAKVVLMHLAQNINEAEVGIKEKEKENENRVRRDDNKKIDLVGIGNSNRNIDEKKSVKGALIGGGNKRSGKKRQK